MNIHQKAEIAIDMLRNPAPVAIDSETTGVVWFKDEAVGWALSDGERSVYVPTRHFGGGNHPNPHLFEERLVGALSYRSKVIVGHNMKFDLHMLYNLGYRNNHQDWRCTMNLEALLNENAHKFDLESVAQRYNVSPKKTQPMYDHLAHIFGGKASKDQMANLCQLPGTDPMINDYAESDALATWQIYKAQAPELDSQHLHRVASVEMKLIPVLVEMERRGIKLDMEYLEKLPDICDENVALALAKLPLGFNARSPKHVKDWVSRFNTDWPLTQKGNPSFTKDYLATFPEGQIINDVREWRYMKESLVIPMLESHAHNGRVHSSFNQNRSDAGGTITGRLSSSHPNMQGVAKHNEKIGKVYRRAFLPDSGSLVEADYSQIEPRLFAHFSQDETLMGGYRAAPPVDVHTLAAKNMKVNRGTTGKRMNMGMFTGMYPKTFAEHMGLPIHEARRLWNQWHATFPGISKFQDDNKLRIMKEGFVTTLLGRRGRLVHNRFAYRATSKIIQGSQADILKYMLIKFDEQFGGDLPLHLTVHDSIVFTWPEDKGPLDLREVVSVMEDLSGDPFNLTVPIKVDTGAGINWAEATYGGK